MQQRTSLRGSSVLPARKSASRHVTARRAPVIRAYVLEKSKSGQQAGEGSGETVRMGINGGLRACCLLFFKYVSA